VRREFGICALLLLAIAIAFAPLVQSDFVHFDDPTYVTENPRVRAGLDAGGVVWAATTLDAGNWHPLTWLSHMLDVELFGLRPGAHHAVNVLLHAANTLLLFALLRFTTGAGTGALARSGFVAALFALHPMHVESVAWISERKDVLSALFWLLSTLAWARWARDGRSRDYALSLGLFALGLTAKPMLVTLPFALLLLDAWPLGRTPLWSGARPEWHRRATWSHLLVEKLPFLLLAAISCAMTLAAQEASGAVKQLAELDVGTRLATALVAFVSYAASALWPAGLAVFYPHPLSWEAWRVLGAGLVLALVSLGVARAAPRQPWLVVGWLWYLGTLVPVIGIVQVGNQWMADRYSYLPFIGLFLAVTWGAPEALRRWPQARRTLPLLAAVALLACGLVTRAQVGYWRDTRALFERALATTSGNFVAHSVLGTEWARAGRFDRAKEHFQRSLELRPDYEPPRLNLVKALVLERRLAEAVPHLRHLLAIRPEDPSSHFDLADALELTGSLDEATAYYASGLALAPDDVEVWRRLAAVQRRLGRDASARQSLAEAQKAERRTRERGGAP
jgi:tetratricopeptide (TPR) repeat protein